MPCNSEPTQGATSPSADLASNSVASHLTEISLCGGGVKDESHCQSGDCAFGSIWHLGDGSQSEAESTCAFTSGWLPAPPSIKSVLELGPSERSWTNRRRAGLARYLGACRPFERGTGTRDMHQTMLFESWSARIRIMDRSSVARLNPPMVPTRSRPFRTPLVARYSTKYAKMRQTIREQHPWPHTSLLTTEH